MVKIAVSSASMQTDKTGCPTPKAVSSARGSQSPPEVASLPFPRLPSDTSNSISISHLSFSILEPLIQKGKIPFGCDLFLIPTFLSYSTASSQAAHPISPTRPLRDFSYLCKSPAYRISFSQTRNSSCLPTWTSRSMTSSAIAVRLLAVAETVGPPQRPPRSVE